MNDKNLGSSKALDKIAEIFLNNKCIWIGISVHLLTINIHDEECNSCVVKHLISIDNDKSKGFHFLLNSI